MSINFERIMATFWGDERRGYSWLGNTDTRFRRRGGPVVKHPTEADWDAYHRAVAGLKALKDYDGTYWQATDYGDGVPKVEEPHDHTVIKWLETEDEWLDRCRKLREAEE